MTRKLMAALLVGVVGFGIASQAQAEDWRHQRWCDWRDRNCDGRLDWRDRDYDRDYYPQRRYDYGRAPTYQPTDSCTFQTRRGPVVGYRPAGKDRCCIETRGGPSCQ